MGKMMDLGYKKDWEVKEKGKDKAKIHYPSASFPLSMFDMREIGDECRIEVVVKLSRKEETDTRKEAGVDMLKARYLGKAGKVSKEEYKKMSDEEREEYDKKEMNL